MKGDTKKQLRSNHQKGHVNKDGVYIKHTELKSKKKEKQGLKEKPPGRRNMDMNPNRGQKFTRPIDFTLGALPMKGGAPKLAPPNFNAPQFGRPPPIGHNGPLGVSPMAPPFPGNRPPQPPNFNPPQPFVGTNMPPPPPNYSFNKPPTFLPPGAPNLQGNIPPPPGFPGKVMPPMPGNFPPFPFKPLAMPPTTTQPPKNE